VRTRFHPHGRNQSVPNIQRTESPWLTIGIENIHHRHSRWDKINKFSWTVVAHPELKIQKKSPALWRKRQPPSMRIFLLPVLWGYKGLGIRSRLFRGWPLPALIIRLLLASEPFLINRKAEKLFDPWEWTTSSQSPEKQKDVFSRSHSLLVHCALLKQNSAYCHTGNSDSEFVIGARLALL